jgi:histidyl-tRNA synthetase
MIWVRRFTGTDVPATGASIGVDRLLTALRKSGRLQTSSLAGPVVVTVMDRARLTDYQQMVAEIRAAGIAVELYLGQGNFRAQMKYADKRNSPAVVIAGEDEIWTGRDNIEEPVAWLPARRANPRS